MTSQNPIDAHAGHGGMHNAMNHGDMNHGDMDHGDMDHGDMDHGDMDHSGHGAGHGTGHGTGHGEGHNMQVCNRKPTFYIKLECTDFIYTFKPTIALFVYRLIFNCNHSSNFLNI